MSISEAIITALIAGVVSIIVSLIGVFISLRQLKYSERKLRFEIRQKYMDKLYDKRMELYPKAFLISSKIKRRKLPQGINTQNEILEILKSLNAWAEEEAGLFMSANAVRSYWDLREVLGKNPGSGEHYHERQIEKIWDARVAFRSALRADIGVLHYADHQIKIP